MGLPPLEVPVWDVPGLLLPAPPARPWLCLGAEPLSCVPQESQVPWAGMGLLLSCTQAPPMQLWLIAFPFRICPCCVLSNVPPTAIRCGHSWGPLLVTSEFILASPLIFLLCLSTPQLSPLGAVSCSSSCMSSRTASLLAVSCSSLSGPALLSPCIGEAGGSWLNIVLQLLLTIPGCWGAGVLFHSEALNKGLVAQ